MTIVHAFGLGEAGRFTNRSITGYAGRDGSLVTVIRQKPISEWASTRCNHDEAEPEYVIEFSDGHSFGCRESELS